MCLIRYKALVPMLHAKVVLTFDQIRSHLILSYRKCLFIALNGDPYAALDSDELVMNKSSSSSISSDLNSMI